MAATLALVMIVKNEATCLERCISSVSRLVDDIIILDTGSTDGTIDIAQRLGVRIHHFEWIDDFSAARNAALDFSTADWNLILDADEWLISGQECLRSLGNTPFIGQIAVQSTFDREGSGQIAIDWISRLLPRGVRYSGRIHEQPDSTSLPRRHIELLVGHDGYLSGKLALKRGRNEALLKKAIDDTPQNAYLLYQLGKNLSTYDQYKESIPYFTDALKLSSLSDSFRHDLVIRTLYALKKADLHEQAITLASDEYEHWQHSPDYFFCIGDIFLDWAVMNPAQAASEYLPIVESSWLKCLELGERPTLSGTVAGRGSYLAAQNLAVLYGNTGQMDLAERYTDIAKKTFRPDLTVKPPSR